MVPFHFARHGQAFNHLQYAHKIRLYTCIEMVRQSGFSLGHVGSILKFGGLFRKVMSGFFPTAASCGTRLLRRAFLTWFRALGPLVALNIKSIFDGVDLKTLLQWKESPTDSTLNHCYRPRDRHLLPDLPQVTQKKKMPSLQAEKVSYFILYTLSLFA